MDTSLLTIIFPIVILTISAVVHEVSHGYAADYLGDPTPRNAGRLTFNPLNHLDPVGSFFIPLVLVLSRSPFLFAFARPVPYTPAYLRWRTFGEAFIAFAGPASNALIALCVALVLHALNAFDALSEPVLTLGYTVVFINVLLALFNLLPLPSFDGLKVLRPFVPGVLGRIVDRIEYAAQRHFIVMLVATLVIFTSVLGEPFFSTVSWISGALVP